jgi:hypothetical protein
MCLANTCVVHDATVGCCLAASDCDDGNPCTIDTCPMPGSASCRNTVEPFCNPCIVDNKCDPEAGETCDNCYDDCNEKVVGSCGDGICSPEIGETCKSCANDCKGKRGGNRRNRYCCGLDVGCSDTRCVSDNDDWKCGEVSGNTCGSESSLTTQPPFTCKSHKQACPNGNEDCCSGRCHKKKGICLKEK